MLSPRLNSSEGRRLVEVVNEKDVEERAQFLLLMRARGVGDLRLLRALERAPRALFVPQRYSDIAARDIALPIGWGETAPPPSVVGAMIEALDLCTEHRVLEIGTGSGYSAALLAQMAGEVISVERRQTLALEATERLAAFGLENVKVVFADGLDFSAGEHFDRILVHALIEPPAVELIERLGPGGVLVAAAQEAGSVEQRIIRLTRRGDAGLDVAAFGFARGFRPLSSGLMRSL